MPFLGGAIPLIKRGGWLHPQECHFWQRTGDGLGGLWLNGWMDTTLVGVGLRMRVLIILTQFRVMLQPTKILQLRVMLFYVKKSRFAKLNQQAPS